jgi:1-phosphofructokinase
MVLTINLNPCIDKSVSVQGLRIGELNRVQPQRADAAGKGLNVAMAVKQLGGEPFCIGFNYSENGRVIVNALDRAGILHDMVTVVGPLRTNLKLFDTASGVYTDLNEPGGFVPPEAVEDLRFRLRRRADSCDYATLSGSAPHGVPKDIYCTLAQDLAQSNARVVLDAEKDLLREGLKAKPWLVKPNLNEMETLFGHIYQDENEVIRDAQELVDGGVEYACVSMGALGALMVSRDAVWKAPALSPLPAKGFQGAGDSMVAGICLAAEKGLPSEEMLRWGAAAASASIILDGTQMCNRLGFEQMLPRVQVQRLL